LAQPIELVLFDAGGVLLLPDAEHVQATLARFGVIADTSAVDRAHYAAMAAVDVELQRMDLATGGLTTAVWENSLQRVYRTAKLHALNLPESAPPSIEDDVFKASWSRVAPGAIETLCAVAGQQLPIAVVSNANGTIEADLKALDICQVGPGAGTCVVAVVDSTRVGVAKPDPAIFRFALEAAGVPPERSLFVGDSVAIDVAGARAAGVAAIHFDPYDFCDDGGHIDIRDLVDVTALTRR
jgi:putative hydrolase of the HAD superfamily